LIGNLLFLGMITAFSECAVRECKKAAISPPFYPGDYYILLDETNKITKEQCLSIGMREI